MYSFIELNKWYPCKEIKSRTGLPSTSLRTEGDIEIKTINIDKIPTRCIRLINKLK